MLINPGLSHVSFLLSMQCLKVIPSFVLVSCVHPVVEAQGGDRMWMCLYIVQSCIVQGGCGPADHEPGGSCSIC